MLKEWIISLYLLCYSFFFTIAKVFPVKKKITFIMSYGENSIFLYNELSRRTTDFQVVFLYKETCKYPLQQFPKVTSIPFENYNLITMIKSSYHLATSEFVIIDNYFGTLANLTFKKQTKCIQLWHAAGAIKNFGFLAQSTNERSKTAIKRFKKVYNKFQHLIVGSENMAEILLQAFGLNNERVIRTGVPRTDLFFNNEKKDHARNELLKSIPQLAGKQVILYAPTFREFELQSPNMSLDIETMYQNFSKDYILLLKLHPAVSSNIKLDAKYKHFAVDLSNHSNINELLLCTDILITDYSSIPFEYAILERPMVFFAYDEDQYKINPGFVKPYHTLVPGPICRTNKEVVQVIRENKWDLEKITTFKNEWNTYSDGKSSEKFWDYFLKEKKEQGLEN